MDTKNRDQKESLSLVCLMSLASMYFDCLAERKVKTKNCLSTFAVVGVVNTEIHEFH